jgi:hypothetical protein
MSSFIDFRTLPANVPSLCIPSVFQSIDEYRIRRVFDDLNIGAIERIDIVQKTNKKGEKSNRVFIHFRHWFNNKNADTSRERLLNGKEIKIIYDDPWFWKVSAYRETNKLSHNEHHRNVEQKRATIQFDSDDDNKIQYQPVRPSEERKPIEGRRPIRPLENRKPIRPIDDHRRPSHNDDRRPSHNDDRRPRHNDDRRPRHNDIRTKDDREKPVNTVQQNVHIPIRPSSPPRTQNEEKIEEQFVSQCQQNAVNKSHYESLVGVAPAVVYDMNVVMSTKKRRIVVKKDTPPPVVKVEITQEADKVEEPDYGW